MASARVVKSFIRLQNDVLLPPQSSTLAVGVCRRATVSPDVTENSRVVRQIGTDFIAKEPGLMVANSVVQLSKCKTVPLAIVNNTGKTMTLNKGNVIARFEAISEEHDISAVAEVSSSTSNKKEHVSKLNSPHGESEEVALDELLHRHRDLFAEADTEVGRTNILKMKIDTEENRPIALKPYRVPFHRSKVVDEQVDQMLQANVIEPCHSPWAFPVVIVRKKDGSERFCVDYRKLNDITVKYHWPLPPIDDIFATLGKSKYFSSLNLRWIRRARRKLPLHVTVDCSLLTPCPSGYAMHPVCLAN